MSEFRLTPPIRRYEINASNEEVHQRVMYALGNRATVYFDLTFADVYRGELPVPEEIKTRTLDVTIGSVSWNRRDELRAFGHVVQDPDASVSILVPQEKERRSVLELVDTLLP